MSILKTSKLSDDYLCYIEEELMGGKGGGRWIASFNMAIRNFNIARAFKEKKLQQKRDYDLVVYGSVRQSGFLLSRFFSFTVSPSYSVGCAIVGLNNAADVKWSFVTKWIRDATNLMTEMGFEWLWLLFFGNKMLPKTVTTKIEHYGQQNLALIYADIRHNTITHSDSFIARRGAILFHSKNLERKGSRLRFRRR